MQQISAKHQNLNTTYSLSSSKYFASCSLRWWGVGREEINRERLQFCTVVQKQLRNRYNKKYFFLFYNSYHYASVRLATRPNAQGESREQTCQNWQCCLKVLHTLLKCHILFNILTDDPKNGIPTMTYTVLINNSKDRLRAHIQKCHHPDVPQWLLALFALVLRLFFVRFKKYLFVPDYSSFKYMSSYQ